MTTLETIGINTEEYRPNVKRMAVKSLLSNIPFVPILNAGSAYYGIKDVKDERDKSCELTWSYILRDLEKLVKDALNPNKRVEVMLNSTPCFLVGVIERRHINA